MTVSGVPRRKAHWVCAKLSGAVRTDTTQGTCTLKNQRKKCFSGAFYCQRLLGKEMRAQAAPNFRHYN